MQAYYHRCVLLLADLDETENFFRDSTPRRLRRVNLQRTLTRHLVMPKLKTFIEQYPGIKLHTGEDDRFINRVREGVDCMLRTGTLQDFSMIGRQVVLLQLVTVASPGYNSDYGEPDTLDDHDKHYAVD